MKLIGVGGRRRKDSNVSDVINSIVALIVVTVVCIILLVFFGRHRSDGKQQPPATTMERLVRVLYRWARWWGSMAVAIDKAVLHFRMEMWRTGDPQPECEHMRVPQEEA